MGWSCLRLRVANVATSLAAAAAASPRPLRHASICRRRGENAMICSRVKPSMSAHRCEPAAGEPRAGPEVTAVSGHQKLPTGRPRYPSP